MENTSGLIERLSKLVQRLRGPRGCPWDREQRMEDLRAYLVEEAHEAAAAIDSGDRDALSDELGDLLFQIVFIAEIAAEESAFDLASVVDRIESKMIARHPHVFGDEALADAAAVRRAWEERKAREKSEGESLLSGVPPSLPALIAAYRIGQKVAAVGFDWPDPAQVLDKLEEELGELKTALIDHENWSTERIGEELGDLLFASASLARHLGLDPEATLASANSKFSRRFARLEREMVAQGHRLGEASLETLEAVWQQIKNDPES